MAVSETVLLMACSQRESLVEKRNIVTENSVDMDDEAEADIYEKGYNLPINDAEREESETDCKVVMEKIREIYTAADKGNASNAVISDEAAGRMREILKETDCPVTINGFHFSMCNYEKMETFLEDSLNGKKGEIVTYEIHLDGGIGREKFIFNGTVMYVLGTTSTWNEKNSPVITYTSYSRIKKWEYTEKGWFIFECCVPEPPEVSEVVNGNVMLRVKPLKDEYSQIAEKYLRPIGYQGNNLLCSNWDEKHMKDIDYNGLFQYLYFIKYGQEFNNDTHTDGILKEEFESLMMEYLPVTAEQLEQYAVYDAENQTYAWVMLGCGNYAPNTFGTSVPEITDMKKNQDGTITLTVDAVCEMAGSDEIMSHQITVRVLENDSIQYLKNQIIEDGLERIPEYQYRFAKETI